MIKLLTNWISNEKKKGCNSENEITHNFRKMRKSIYLNFDN